MRSARTIAFIILALLAGAILTQLPPALGDDSQNPFSALWAAIFDLQNRDEDLQAQIDELRAERDGLLIESAQSSFVSDTYTNIEVEATEDGRTLAHITAGNNGPDRAAGVKLTAFYLMPLYKINSINDDRCENQSRGIIECALGTLEAHQESVITIDTSARESGNENKWTADVSTTTDDVDYTNNHMTSAFATGGVEPVETPEEQEQSVLQEDTSDVPGAVSKEDSGSGVNSTSAETEESQSAGNQTSDETGEETVNDTNSTSAEQSEDSQSSEETQQTSEGSGESSSETSNGQTEQQSESGTGESSEDSNEPGTEESSSKQSATEASESSDSAENPSQ
jgi:hypothetical protein